MYYQSGDTDIQMATLKRTLNIARNGSTANRRKRRPRKSTGRKVGIRCHSPNYYWYSPYFSDVGLYLYYISLYLFYICISEIFWFYNKEKNNSKKEKETATAVLIDTRNTFIHILLLLRASLTCFYITSIFVTRYSDATYVSVQVLKSALLDMYLYVTFILLSLK